jgi:ASC-1-like (ASCH) protein
MNTKETKKNIIQAGQRAVEELIKVAKEAIVDSDDDISADRLKNAAATKKLAIFDAFEILSRIEEEENLLNENLKKLKKKELLKVLLKVDLRSNVRAIII